MKKEDVKTTAEVTEEIVEEETTAELAEVEEPEEEVSLPKKVIGVVKKHGKKIGTAVLVAGAGIAAGVFLSKKSKGENYSDYDYDNDPDVIDVEASEVE